MMINRLGRTNGSSTAMDKQQFRLRGAGILLLFATYACFWAFVPAMWELRNTELNGIVVSSQDVPAKGAPQYETYYVVKKSDGSMINYVAGPAITSLPRSMPIGTVIRKIRGETRYQIDGHWVGSGGEPWLLLALSVFPLLGGVLLILRSFGVRVFSGLRSIVSSA
jgi:hypothetical protein